jgi:uncharacterized protein YfkK (UPF0435 family)
MLEILTDLITMLKGKDIMSDSEAKVILRTLSV